MKNIRKQIFISISLICFMGSFFLFWRYAIREKEEQTLTSAEQANDQILKALQSENTERGTNSKDRSDQIIDEKQFSNKLLDRLNNKHDTDNIIAFIDTGEGGIREVVGYRADSDYFDRRNIKGEYDYNGTVFLYKENKSPNDPYTNYFAHNVQSGERFFKLSRYEEYKDHLQTAKVYTREGMLNYELVQVAIIDSILFDQYMTWEQCGIKNYFQHVASIGNLIFQKEDFSIDKKYMQLITCRDDLGKIKIIATYALKTERIA